MTGETPDSSGAAPAVVAVVAWLWILVPFLYGVIELLIKIGPLFSS